jgi:hypothetical protein
MSVSQILSGVSSGVAGSLMYVGVFTAAADTTTVRLPGIAAPAALSVELTTYLQTAPIPVSTVAGSLGNVAAAVAARTMCIPLTLLAGQPTVTAAGTAHLVAPAAAAGTTFGFAGAASANNVGKWLLLMFQ